jgi:hypothetical protein
MGQAGASGISLGYRETSVVKGMLARGDRQHDIGRCLAEAESELADVKAAIVIARDTIQQKLNDPTGRRPNEARYSLPPAGLVGRSYRCR